MQHKYISGWCLPLRGSASRLNGGNCRCADCEGHLQQAADPELTSVMPILLQAGKTVMGPCAEGQVAPEGAVPECLCDRQAFGVTQTLTRR